MAAPVLLHIKKHQHHSLPHPIIHAWPMQAVPYIRAAASQLPLAVQRLEQVSQALPQAWLHNQAAVGLVEVCKSLARNMERSKPSSQVSGASSSTSKVISAMLLRQ